jgi:hypothetical protein
MATTASPTISPSFCIVIYGFHKYEVIGKAIGGAAMGTQYIYASEVKLNRTASMG